VRLVVAHEARQAGETVITFAHRQLLRLATRLSEFTLLETQEFQVDGRRATRTRFRHKVASGVVEQAVAYVDSPQDENAILAFTCSSRPGAAVGCWEVLTHTFATARFAEGEATDDPITAPFAVPIPASPSSSPAVPPPPPSRPVHESGFFGMKNLPEIPMPGSAGGSGRRSGW
jgi:hypothetical protein